MMSQTLLLDSLAWDLTLDTSGNIAVASEPYALAQDAASAIRLFAGELYYDTTQGVPYFSQILGKTPALTLVKHYLNTAALSVPGVASAQTFLLSWNDRTFKGQVQIKTTSGAAAVAGI